MTSDDVISLVDQAIAHTRTKLKPTYRAPINVAVDASARIPESPEASENNRKRAIAITHLETAALFLKDVK